MMMLMIMLMLIMVDTYRLSEDGVNCIDACDAADADDASRDNDADDDVYVQPQCGQGELYWWMWCC